MGQQEQLVCTCDRCARFQVVTVRSENGNYFEKPTDWKEWDDREGTCFFLCPTCDRELRAFLQPKKMKATA